MQWILATLIDCLLQFLEASFERPKIPLGGDDHDFFSTSSSNTTNPDTTDSSREKAIMLLKQAYEFMELKNASPTQPPTDDELKKQYKRLSLRYHPDRNGGSDESKGKFQKLRACMDIIEKHLAGVVDDDENSNKEEDEEEKETQSASASSARYKQYQEMRRAAEQEMKDALQRQEELKQEFLKNKSKDRKECEQAIHSQKLHLLQVRDDLNREFEQDVEQRQQQQQQQDGDKAKNPTQSKTDIHSSSIDSDNEDDADNKDDQETTTTTTPKTMTKPKNLVMEYNLEEVVIAMRMKIPEVTLSLMEQDIVSHMKETAGKLYFDGIKPTLKLLQSSYFLQSLDDDGNSLLHYAVYYESYQVIRAICATAQKEQFLDELFQYTNRYGHTPIYLSTIAEDPSIRLLLESQIAYIEQIQTQTKVGPALQAARKRGIDLIQNLGMITTLETILSFWIVYNTFDMHYLLAIIVLVLMNVIFHHTDESSSSMMIPGLTSISVLLGSCAIWKGGQWGLSLLLEYVMWELLLLLAPFGIAAFYSSSGGRHGGGIVNRFIVGPLAWFWKVCKYIHVVLSWLAVHTMPKMLKRQGLVKLCLLVLIATLPPTIIQAAKSAGYL